MKDQKWRVMYRHSEIGCLHDNRQQARMFWIEDDIIELLHPTCAVCGVQYERTGVYPWERKC